MKNKKPNGFGLLRLLNERFKAIYTILLNIVDTSAKTVDFALSLHELVSRRDPEAQVMVNHNLDFVIVTGCPLPLLREDIVAAEYYSLKVVDEKKVLVMALESCSTGGHRCVTQLIQSEA